MNDNLNNKELKEQIYFEIQQEFKAKYNVHISISEIKQIIDCQFKHVKLAIENKEDISIPYFGTFAIKPGREDYLNYKKQLDNEYISKEEKQKLLKIRAKEIVINKLKK